MTETRSIDVSQLPDYSISNRSLLFFGQVLMSAIEGTMLFILIATYFYLRLGVDVWPPPGVELPGALLPTLALIPLALSCGGSYWASESAKKNDRGGMLLGMGLNVFLGVVFLGLREFEWHRLNFSWASDAHGSIFWAILYLHSMDVVADLLYTLVLIVIVILNRDGPKQRLGVHVDSVIWYFLAAVWLPLYAVIYWGPRFVGAPR